MHASAKAAFEEMERQGVVRRSSSCWASPLYMVKKADSSWQPCGNFWRLNSEQTFQRMTDRVINGSMGFSAT
jgi:hypothetical protein